MRARRRRTRIATRRMDGAPCISSCLSARDRRSGFRRRRFNCTQPALPRLWPMSTARTGVVSRQNLLPCHSVFRPTWSFLMVYRVLDVAYGSSERSFGDHTTFNFRFGFAETCVLLRPSAQQAKGACLAAAIAAVSVGLGLPALAYDQQCHTSCTVHDATAVGKSRYNNYYYLDVLFAILVVVTDIYGTLSN